MIKPPPETLAVDLLTRSICLVQVAAVIVGRYGIHSWGWNSVGTGYGIHAEAHAIGRSNKKRLRGSTIYVAAQRNRNNKMVLAKPCEDCQKLIDKWGLRVVYRDRNGAWGAFQ